jgi:cysteine desulfurase
MEIIMNKPIYLDYNATTPIDPVVAKAMIPYLYEHFGNPSSNHPYGLQARQAVEKAREQVAGLLNCLPGEIIFTSGGTESNNYALRGAAFANQGRGVHIITSAIEHPAVTEVCSWLETQGFHINTLPVDAYGRVDPKSLADEITSETILVSIMLANNEVGTIQPVKELVEITHRVGALFHTDAAQAVGKINVDVLALDVDLLSVAGHKLYAPKGVGAIYIKEGIEIPNLTFGAGHESGHRPGTENVLEIVGLGAACELARRDLEEIQLRCRAARDQLHQGLEAKLGAEGIRLNGHLQDRLPNTLNLSFKNIPADQLLGEIKDDVAASAGAACHADQVRVSGVLEAMGVPLEWAMGAVRFSVGRETSREEIEAALQVIANAMKKIKD